MPNVRNLLPHLACSPAIQDALSHSNLTLEEFVTKDVHELPWPSQMDHVQRQEAAAALLGHVQNFCAPPVQLGSDLLQPPVQPVMTGCPKLDSLLGGGWAPGQMTELVGAAGTGKTQVWRLLIAAVMSDLQGVSCKGCTAQPSASLSVKLCLQAVLTAGTLFPDTSILYVDTFGAFSTTRLAGMYATRSRHAQMQRRMAGPPGSIATALRNTTVCRVHDIHHLQAVLEAYAAQASAALGQGGRHLVIVDSIAALVTPILSAGGAQDSTGHALMLSTAQQLRFLALQLGATVLVTNHMVGGTEDPRPALGTGWHVQPHWRVRLSLNEGNLRTAAILASPAVPLLRAVAFTIDDRGVV